MRPELKDTRSNKATTILARGGTSQTNSFIDLLEQQHAAIADDVASIESSLDNTPSNAPKLNGLIGTIWHRWSSVFIGVRYL